MARGEPFSLGVSIGKGSESPPRPERRTGLPTETWCRSRSGRSRGIFRGRLEAVDRDFKFSVAAGTTSPRFGMSRSRSFRPRVEAGGHPPCPPGLYHDRSVHARSGEHPDSSGGGNPRGNPGARRISRFGTPHFTSARLRPRGPSPSTRRAPGFPPASTWPPRTRFGSSSMTPTASRTAKPRARCPLDPRRSASGRDRPASQRSRRAGQGGGPGPFYRG